jgi:DNA polymerase I-like protein with 3'-5' exonuclease and polymerase domains
MIEADVETRGLQWYYPSQEMFMAQFFDPEDGYCQFKPERCPECGGAVDDSAVGVGDWECLDCHAQVPDEARAVILQHPKDREAIQAWLNKAAEGGGIRAWNSKFDLHMFEAVGYRLPPPETWHDGMVVARILDERKSMGLQATGDGIFGTEPWPKGAGIELEKRLKTWLAEETKRRRDVCKETGERLIKPTYADVPAEILEPYAAHDVELQWRIMDVLEPKLAEADRLSAVYELERGVLASLYDVERRGMGIDDGRLERLEVEVERELCERTERVAELAGRKGDEDFNPRSSEQLAEAFERRGADLSFCKTTKTGKKSLDQESLEAISDDLARAVEDFRASETMYTRYVYPLLHPTTKRGIDFEPFLAPDGRVHADLNQVGARTGRMSSSPNVQNWPRDDLRMRDLVMADEGKKLVACDLDQIELRLFAAFLGEGKVLEMMMDPDSDIHTYTAKMVGLKDRDRGGGVVESPRQRGKKFNYERIYGGGVRAIRRWHGVGQKEAKEMLLRYYEAFPEVQEFQNQIEFTLFDKGFVRTPWGRRHRPYNRRAADREAYKFVNYLVQGAAADLFKESVVRIYKLGIPMIALTHDEILAEVDAKEADEAGELIRKELINHPKITKIVPIDSDKQIVDRWSHAKDKSFKPSYA